LKFRGVAPADDKAAMQLAVHLDAIEAALDRVWSLGRRTDRRPGRLD